MESARRRVVLEKKHVKAILSLSVLADQVCWTIHETSIVGESELVEMSDRLRESARIVREDIFRGIF